MFKINKECSWQMIKKYLYKIKININIFFSKKMLMNFNGAFSLGYGKRTQQINKEDIPGPGTYESVKFQKVSSPKWTMRNKNKTDLCFNINKQIPAPGQYQLQTPTKIKKNVKKKKQFSLSTDKPKNIQRYYSRNNINLPSSIQTTKGHQFGYKLQDKILELSPGPTYNVNQLQDNKKKIKKQSSNGFGFGKRDAIYKQLNSQTPGPGSYNQPQFNDNKGSILFPKGQRKILTTKDQNSQLGPGTYDPKIIQFNKGCKIKGRIKDNSSNGLQNVGPGAYKIPEVKSPTSVKFVDSKIQSLIKLDKNKTPSPFQYNPKRFPDAYKSNEGFRMGYAQRNKYGAEQNTPGPGQYQIPRNLNTNGVIIATKLKSIQKRQNKFQMEEQVKLANIKYDLVTYKAPVFSFPTEILNKNKSTQNSTIGPGTYDPKLMDGRQKYSIGKAQRFKGNTQQQMQYFNSKVSSTIGYIPNYLLNGKK